MMNPWDNVILALRLAWPGYLAAFGFYFAVRVWIWHLDNRPLDYQFTDEQYADGFYRVKERAKQE